MDRDELHDVYRGWRAVADAYDEPRLLVGEIWLPDAERLARYLRPRRAAHRVQLRLPRRVPGTPDRLRATIDAALASHVPIDAPPTWVLSNHDVTRPATRYGREDTAFSFEAKRAGTPTDLARGTRRARAAALLTMALPGSMYVYQGEELGLPEVEDIPDDRRRDPMHARSGGVHPGRDGCRVPIPWSGNDAAVRVQLATASARGSTSRRRLELADRRGAGGRCLVDAHPLPAWPRAAPTAHRGVRTPSSSGCRRRTGRSRSPAATQLRLPHQLRPRPGSPPGRGRAVAREQRAPRRCTSPRTPPSG